MAGDVEPAAGDPGPMVRHRSAPGPAQVWVYMLGQWRRVFEASDRAAAEKYAREQGQLRSSHFANCFRTGAAKFSGVSDQNRGKKFNSWEEVET